GEAQLPSHVGEAVEIGELDVRAIGGVTAFLRADEDHPRTRCQVVHIAGQHLDRLGARHVFDQVRGEHPTETAGPRVFGAAELLGRERLQATLPADVDGTLVVVDADTARRKMGQVTAQPAAHVEYFAVAEQPANVPPVGRLHVEQTLPQRL